MASKKAEPEAQAPEAPAAEAPDVVAMVHPDGGDSDTFDHAKDGALLVPSDRVAEMMDHGFVPKD